MKHPWINLNIFPDVRALDARGTANTPSQRWRDVRAQGPKERAESALGSFARED